MKRESFALRRAALAPGLLVLAALYLAGAQAAPVAEGSRLFAPCVPCHSPGGGGSSDGNIPNLAGQQPRYLEKQLSMFRSAARVDTAMQVVTAHPSFADHDNILGLARYLAALAPNPMPVNGPGTHLQAAQETFAHICAGCHGLDGRGESTNRVPRIAGQHYPYLRRQIEEAARLHRDLAPPEMTGALRAMPPEEREALADYISRLGTQAAPPAPEIDPALQGQRPHNP